MNETILTKTYSASPIDEKEILRYAGGIADDNTIKLLNECINEALDCITYKVCYHKLPVKINGDLCDFGVFNVQSKNLATNLSGCNSVIIFGATIGIGIDRLITKYSHISPAKALMLQAFGAERIEALCDYFCKDIQNTLKTQLKTRFRAGYGDIPLDTQKQVFSLLNLPKNIGLTLNDSLLMSPTKSVTAFIGMQEV